MAVSTTHCSTEFFVNYKSCPSFKYSKEVFHAHILRLRVQYDILNQGGFKDSSPCEEFVNSGLNNGSLHEFCVFVAMFTSNRIHECLISMSGLIRLVDWWCCLFSVKYLFNEIIWGTHFANNSPIYYNACTLHQSPNKLVSTRAGPLQGLTPWNQIIIMVIDQWWEYNLQYFLDSSLVCLMASSQWPDPMELFALACRSFQAL